MVRIGELSFPVLNCSSGRELGDYYQDLSAANFLVESGFHGGFDAGGVPMVDYGTQGRQYNAVIVAQYAIANLTAARRGERDRFDRARTQLDWLVGAQAGEEPFSGCWIMDFDSEKYRWLTRPWTSALASGNAISALLRGAETFESETYLVSAQQAYEGLHRPRDSFVLCDQADGDLWYAEYPARQPMHVLNGHIYTLLGVLDYARVTADTTAERRWRAAADTLRRHLHEFDLGFWSAYDLLHREPASRHYHKNIHVPLLRVLHELTGASELAFIADKWERQARSPLSRLRWQVSLRTHRVRSQKRLATELDQLTDPGPWSDQLDAGDARVVAIEGGRDRAIPEIEMRRFPYPYRAALSLSNDADLLTPSSFRRLYAFLCGAEETEWGTGLSLNLGGSFFMFRSPNSPNELTVCDRLDPRVTPEGSYLLECAGQGVLDVLHTFGCFTDQADFSRPLAEAGLEILADHGVRIQTWVNHGPTTNIQCLGEAPDWQGDRAGTRGYHADLTVGYGVRWVWTGMEITDRFVLEGVGTGASSDGIRERVNGPRARSHAAPPKLVEPFLLSDGHSVCRFYRFAGLRGRTPVLDDLPGQLTSDRLDELERAGGYAIVYQHLAVRRKRAGFGPEAYGPVGEEWFRENELKALRRLATRYHQGSLWVAPTTWLLRHREMQKQASWRVEKIGDDDAIVVESATNSVSDGMLRGLTFYCDRPERVRVFLDAAGELEPVKDVLSNPADHTGRRSLTVRPLPTRVPLP